MCRQFLHGLTILKDPISHYLMDDTRAGVPEANSVLGTSTAEEVVHLLVQVLGTAKILLTTNLKRNIKNKSVKISEENRSDNSCPLTR